VKDDSARDKAIEQLVTEKLRSGAPKTATGCPDAEIIAAYFERTLTPKERASWEVHFDSCARCQARIAALVRMDQTDEASLTVPKAASKAPGRKIFGLRWAWAAPVLLAGVVAGLWYTGEFGPLLHQTTETGARVSSPTTAPTKPPETFAAAQGNKPPAIPAQKQQAKAPPTPRASGELKTSPQLPGQRSSNAPPPEPQILAKNQMPEAVQKSNVRPDTEREAPTPSAMELKASPQAEAAQGAIAPPVERARLEAAPHSARENSGVDRSTAEGTPVANGLKLEPGTESSAGEAGTSAAGQSRSATVLGGFAAKDDLVRAKTSSEAQGATSLLGGSGVHYAIVSAPSDKDLGKTSTPELWRVGPHGLIQKQNPDGLWGTKTSGVSADLFDITFPRPQVGWAVGQDGVVLRSERGGESWVRVSSPTREDLVRVTATSAESAQVTTRSGIVFSTTDGAMSWTRSTSAP
jgi:Photosynthesis system II assembly factor YCF48